MTERKPYPTDVSDAEWSFAAPYLTLMNEDAPQRRYELCEMFNALRRLVERSFGWLNHFRRPVLDYESLPETLASLHFVVFAMLMLEL